MLSFSFSQTIIYFTVGRQRCQKEMIFSSPFYMIITRNSVPLRGAFFKMILPHGQTDGHTDGQTDGRTTGLRELDVFITF